MIVQAEIPVRADFVPRRARNVRRGHAVETMSFSVREVAGTRMRPVLTATTGGTVRTAGEMNGLLWSPLPDWAAPSSDPATILTSMISTRAVATGLCPGTDRSETAAPGSSSVVSRRDDVASAIQRWLDQEVVLVDGRIHKRTASPVVPMLDFVGGDAKTAEEATARTGLRQVPVWFASVVPGLPACALPKSWTDEAFAVVDPTLHREASLDPRNVDLDQLAEGVKRRYMEERPAVGTTVRTSRATSGLPHLLRAMASAEAMSGTSLPDIERILTVVAENTRVDLPPSVLTGGEAGRLVSLTLSPQSRAVVSTACPSQVTKLNRDVDRLFFRVADVGKAEKTARRLAGRGWLPSVIGDIDEDTEFDLDAWNLAVAFEHVLSRIDERVGLLSKPDLDALARIAVHVRDWRADVRLVDVPERREGFVRDAASIVAILDGPVFEDVGEEWMGEIAAWSCAADLDRRRQETSLLEEDAELSSFSFSF